jgi:hypothetical protein
LKRVFRAIRQGTWLTLDRIYAYSLVLLCGYALLAIVLFATAHGRHDMFGRPLGTDFSEVWAAGNSVLAGHPEAPFDIATHYRTQQALFGAGTGILGWHYPPYFLAVAALLALLPYVAALLLWQGTSLAAFATVCVACLHWRRVWVPVLGFPAVFVCFGHGQNGFLTAALFGAAGLCLPARPLAAGVLFGLLAYKPQFGLVIPVALLAGRQFRAVGAAGLTVACMTLGTLVVFGAGAWRAFFAAAHFTRTVVLEQGNTGWEKIQSAFSAARMWHAGIGLAYAVQGLVTAGVIVTLGLMWHGRADHRLRVAALMVGALLATPYCLDYDMTLLGPALALAADHGLERGFAPWEKTILALTWLAPLLARWVASAVGFPLGLCLMLMFFGMLASRAGVSRQAMPR